MAKSQAQAAAARDAMIVEWDKGHLWQQAELEKAVTAGGSGGIVLQKDGKVKSALSKGISHTAEYRTGFGAHAPLETQAALADMSAEGGRIWTSTQSELSAAKYVASELGIGVGISSGANFIGALKVQNEMGRDANIVTVFPDDNKKYLSTDLLQNEPVKDDFLSPDIELLGYRALKRVCHTCCNPKECMESLSPDFQEKVSLPRCPRRP